MSAHTTSYDAPSDPALRKRLKRVIDAGPAAIGDRLNELSREMTAGRATVVTTAVVILAGLTLSSVHNPWWLMLTAVGGALMIVYLIGYATPIGWAFQRLGLRTRADVEAERTALKVLRGDFENLPTAAGIEDRDALSRMEAEGGPAVDDEVVHRPDADEAVSEVLVAARL